MGRHTPALLGGLFIGVIASLPVVGACCCLWCICGGMLTTTTGREVSGGRHG